MLGFIFFNLSIFFLLFRLNPFKKTASQFLTADIFSLSGPEGIKFPFPIKFSLLKQTIFKL